MGNYCYKTKKHQNFKVLNHNGSCQPYMPEVTNFNYLQSTGVQTKNESLLLLSKSVQCSYSPEVKRFTSTNNKRINLNQSRPIPVGNKEELNSSIYEDKLTTSSKWKCVSPHCNTKNNLFCKTCSNLSANKQIPKLHNEPYPILSNDMTSNNINEQLIMNKPFEAGGDYKLTSSHTYPSTSYFHGVQTSTNESAKLNRFHQFIRENHYCSGNPMNNQTSRPHLSYETCMCKNSSAYHPMSLYPQALTHTCCEHKFLPGYIRNSEICLTQANRKYLLDDYCTSNWSNLKRRNSMLLLKPFNDQCFSMDNIHSVNYQDKLLQNNFPYYHKPTICQMNHSSYHINHNNEILEMNYNDREERLNDQTILRREHRSKSCEIPKSSKNLNITPCSRSYSLLSSGKLAKCASQTMATSRNEYVPPPPPSPIGISRNQQDNQLNDEMKSSLNSSVNDTHWLHSKNTPSLHSMSNTKMNYTTNYSQRFEDLNILHNINNLPQVYDVSGCQHYATPSSCYNLSHIMHQKYKACKCFNCERHLYPEGDHDFLHYADSLQRLYGERRRQQQQHQQQSCEFMKSSTHTSQPVEYWLNSANSTMYNPMNHLDRKQNNPDNSDGIKPTPCRPINSKVNHKTTHNSSSGSVRSSGSHRQHHLSSTRNSHSSRSPSHHNDGTVKVVKSKVDLEPTMNNLSSNHNYYTTQSFKHRFFLKETCGIEKIISDPTDRRIRAICDRFRCDLEVYSKIPKNGYLQYVIDISSPNLWALHGCARALDSSLNWCLTPQLAV